MTYAHCSHQSLFVFDLALTTASTSESRPVQTPHRQLLYAAPSINTPLLQ